ncbi:MAG: glycosyltransferase family 2 protein [Chromatiales bacterium]
MGVPYASIIIPTHDRHSTLPYAVHSALSQTVRDIEVVVVGDGCTREVRAVAEGLAAEDPRVRFLDRPKASQRGAANRDFAVRTALALRIFYNDDDDLLMPRHVELLGAALDRCDIVDTPVASVGTEGRVALGLHASGHPLQRRLLADGRFKGVFDTHLAHRKEAYIARAGWTGARDREDVVLHMLKGFAAAGELRWTTLDRISALSLHGVRRLGMSAQRRARELAHWSKDLSDSTMEAALRARGGYCFHALRLVDATRGAPARARRGLLQAVGLPPSMAAEAASGGRWRRLRALPLPRLPRAEPEEGRIPFSREQRAALEAVFSLARGIRPDPKGAGRALDELLQPVLGPFFHVDRLIDRFARLLGPARVSALLDGLSTCTALPLARFHLAVHQRSVGESDRRAVRFGFETAPPESRFFFGLSVVDGLIRLGDPAAAWDWAEELAPLAPASRHAVRFWEVRRSLATDAGRGDQAALAAERIAELTPSPV